MDFTAVAVVTLEVPVENTSAQGSPLDFLSIIVNCHVIPGDFPGITSEFLWYSNGFPWQSRGFP